MREITAVFATADEIAQRAFVGDEHLEVVHAEDILKKRDSDFFERYDLKLVSKFKFHLHFAAQSTRIQSLP